MNIETPHTFGPLQVSDGALLCKNVNAYGNFIIADCQRERTVEDEVNLKHLAHCWNTHDELLKRLDEIAAMCMGDGLDYARALTEEQPQTQAGLEMCARGIRGLFMTIADKARAKINEPRNAPIVKPLPKIGVFNNSKK